MFLRLTEIRLTLDEEESDLPEKAAKALKISPDKIRDLTIIRKSLDARKKNRITFVYTLNVEVNKSDISQRHLNTPHVKIIEKETPASFPKLEVKRRPIVIGTGPAGLFAALRLSEYGLRPLLIERGSQIKKRVSDVKRFWNDRILNPESNVQFGEGGAGTFSDGKLTTRVDDPRTSFILQTFVDAGADSEILYLAKPHIGTDRLRSVIANMRQLLIERGCEFRFDTKVTGFNIHSGKIESVIIDDEEKLFSDVIILAIGHSARDTYEALFESGVEMTAKSFAIGLRVEHPQELINRIQYGPCAGHPRLPAAEYVITHNMKGRSRSAYSFCMCPGGAVINASSEPGGLVINGMSQSKRNSPFANSALIATVTPDDFGMAPLDGMNFQRKWETIAYQAGGSNYNAPSQNLMAFLGSAKDLSCKTSSFLPGLTDTDLADCLPEYVADALREALPVFDRKMRGFMTQEATLIGVETRTSAPLRIVRGKDFQSATARGLYPCGEGAGYAGGIMSSALDGIKVADAIAESF